MKTKGFGVVVVLAASVTLVYAGGTATVHTFYSEALDTQKTALVYLPEGYDSSGLDYPVVYFMQGADGGVGNWYLTDFVPILDDMISEGLIDPAIIVEPDSVSCPAPAEWQALGVRGRVYSSHTNSDLLGDNEDYLVEDLVNWVDDSYRTIADREHRWLLGRSMGGHGAIRFSMRHPEVFGATSIDSGVMDMAGGYLPELMPYVLGPETQGPPYDFAPTNGWNSLQIFSFCAAFTPNMANPPWYVDFLLNENGSINEDVRQRLLSQSPPALVHAYAGSGYPVDLYLRIGNADQFADTFWPVIDALELENIPHLVRTFEGNHWDPELNVRLEINLTYLLPFKATVEISPTLADPRLLPNTLRAVFELPGDLEVDDIDCDSLVLLEIDGHRLDQPISSRGVCEVSDVNGNDRDDLTVEFPCSIVVGAAMAQGSSSGDRVVLTVRGELDDGRFFEATDNLTVVGAGAPLS